METVETESEETEREIDLRLGLLLRPRFSDSGAEPPLRRASASANCLSATPLLMEDQTNDRKEFLTDGYLFSKLLGLSSESLGISLGLSNC